MIRGIPRAPGSLARASTRFRRIVARATVRAAAELAALPVIDHWEEAERARKGDIFRRWHAARKAKASA